ncbi:winged helix-turn-helix transcriptional regulator [Candidatus Micrarchaeota archaeon]|nr:winged helix-turn-helix transcriptional regulator [Candidatus Micrarchaeota archaeon]
MNLTRKRARIPVVPSLKTWDSRGFELDAGKLKLLGSETRVALLKKLRAKPRSLSGLAEELKLSVQSTHEQLEKLAKADLVEKSRRAKWSYYALTESGKALVSPSPTPVYFLLGLSFLLIFSSVLGYFGFIPYAPAQPGFGVLQPEAAPLLVQEAPQAPSGVCADGVCDGGLPGVPATGNSLQQAKTAAAEETAAPLEASRAKAVATDAGTGTENATPPALQASKSSGETTMEAPQPEAPAAPATAAAPEQNEKFTTTANPPAPSGTLPGKASIPLPRPEYFAIAGTLCAAVGLVLWYRRNA